MRAVLATYARGKKFLGIRLVHGMETPVAAAAFVESGGDLEFLGTGPSDYLDLLARWDLSADEEVGVKETILAQARRAMPSIRGFWLRNLPREQGTPDGLLAKRGPLYSTFLRTAPAPTMDASALPEAIRKDALRRSEKKLARLGTVSAETFTESDAIMPRLEGFFDLHRQRWAQQPSATPFHDPMGREFYRRMTSELSPSGAIRYTEVRLDGRLVAAHYGFVWAGRFIWYKPCFDPELGSYSPGVVLLSRLFRRAIEEGVEEFDFTIGDEAFKSRYATREREVIDMYVTNSWARSAAVRVNRATRRWARQCLNTLRGQLKGKRSSVQRNSES